MDWENERYIRYYLRDTVTYLTWPWEAQALIGPLLRKLDRRGRLNIGEHDLIDAVWSIYPKWPREVIEVGLGAMLKCKTLVHEGQTLRAPNFRPAQEAKKSDALRKREQRERERLTRDGGGDSGQDVTIRDGSSQNPRIASREVTLAEPSLAEPSLAEPTLPGVQGGPEVADAPPPREKRVAARQVSNFRPKPRARKIYVEYENQRAACLGGNVTEFTDDHYRAMQQTVRYIQQERACDSKVAWDWLEQFGKVALDEALSPEHTPEWAEKLRRWRVGPNAWAKKRYQAVMAKVDSGSRQTNGTGRVKYDDQLKYHYFVDEWKRRVRCDEEGERV